MNFFKKFFLIFFIFFSFSLAVADNHDSKKEILDQAKEITDNIKQEDSLDEEEVPLNDPFAGNEGTNNSRTNIDPDEERDVMSLYNFKLSGLISGENASYISLTDSSGDVINVTLGQNLGKIKLVDLRLTEAIFKKEDKSYIIIDFNNQIRETDDY
tara:strand:+ start:555 stop:1022 length:468 start_codon:yes stop_codon:yes gene_type:complete